MSLKEAVQQQTAKNLAERERARRLREDADRQLLQQKLKVQEETNVKIAALKEELQEKVAFLENVKAWAKKYNLWMRRGVHYLPLGLVRHRRWKCYLKLYNYGVLFQPVHGNRHGDALNEYSLEFWEHLKILPERELVEAVAKIAADTGVSFD